MTEANLQKQILDYIRQIEEEPSIPKGYISEELCELKIKVNVAFAVRQSRNDELTIGLRGVANDIIGYFGRKIERTVIERSQDVEYILTQYKRCVEFIVKYLDKLCASERSHNTGGYTGNPTPQMLCNQMRNSNLEDSKGTIWLQVNKKINGYNIQLLKIWADVLINDGMISPDEIRIAHEHGYERALDIHSKKVSDPHGMKSNLEEDLLREFLTLIHIGSVEQILNHPPQLGYYLFSIVSQFIPCDEKYGTPHPHVHPRPIGSHSSKLNVLKFTCNIILKPYLPSDPSFFLFPVPAYLSSHMLDQFVSTLKHFPTSTEVKSFLEIPTPSISLTSTSSAISSAPPEKSDGGKKRTRINKKYTKYRRNKISKYRFRR
jgi:hypothetical protein